MEKLHSAELGVKLQELLDAPLESAVHVLGSDIVPPVIPTDAGTARALFAHPSPPVELLDAVFLAAQHHSHVPRMVADVMQLAALSVAIRRCGFDVPAYEQPTFRHLFEVAADLKWIDEETRDVLDDGLAALTPYDHAAPPPPVDQPHHEAPHTAEPHAATPKPTTVRGILSEMARANAANAAKAAKAAKLAKEEAEKNDARPLSITMTIAAAIVAAAVAAVPLYHAAQVDDPRGPQKMEGIDSGQINQQRVDAKQQ